MKKIAFAGCAHIHTPSFVRVINECSANVTVAKVWDHAPARAEDNAKNSPPPSVRHRRKSLMIPKSQESSSHPKPIATKNSRP